MRILSRRLIVAAGVMVAVASLVSLSFMHQGAVLGQETDVAVQADAGAGAAGPPASLPDAGDGNVLTPNGSPSMLMVLLAGAGITLAAAGLLARRRARPIERDG